jgi:valyl-tRNA synthetase
LTKTSEKVNSALEQRDFYESTQAIYNFWLYDLCDVYIENSKFLILEGTEEQKKSARDTLYTCIDGALRLIHPFMPFISEEMWQRLPKRASETSKTIVKAAYPVYVPEYDNAEAAAAYELVLEITKGARSLLSQYGITKNGSVFVESANSKFFEIADSQKDSIVSLIKAVEKVNVVSAASEIPSGCVLATVVPEVNVHLLVKGMIDIDSEVTKFASKLDKSKKALTNLEKIMTSADYESKASDAAKEKNQQSKEKTLADIEGFEQTIANLEKLKL